MDLTTITVKDFKSQFPRDFPYETIDNSDIERAFVEAQMTFNQALFGEDAYVQVGYLYLTAHYLVIDLRSAKAGLSSIAESPVSSRSVGNVSESYQIPEWITKNPTYQFYTQTGYGRKYLNFVIPKLRGNVVSVAGATQA